MMNEPCALCRWELVTINPGFVMGPPLGDREDGSSVGFIKEMLNGKLAMAPPLGFGVVPVQDVATAHCLAMVHPDAKGRCGHTLQPPGKRTAASPLPSKPP